jgi:Holliday junction resolvase
MTHPSKAKGNRFESDVVKEAKGAGLESLRSYASDGRTRGLPAEVDVTIENYTVQCKIRKKLAAYLYPEEGIDIQVVRQDYGEALAIIPLSMLIRLIAIEKETK